MLQETHTSDERQLKQRGTINGFTLATASYHKNYGSASYVRQDITNWKHLYTSTSNSVSNITICVAGITIHNIYKPPNDVWPNPTLPTTKHPTIYAGDFNSHHTNWGYATNDQNGDKLHEWIESEDMHLVFYAKDRPTVHSGNLAKPQPRN